MRRLSRSYMYVHGHRAVAQHRSHLAEPKVNAYNRCLHTMIEAKVGNARALSNPTRAAFILRVGRACSHTRAPSNTKLTCPRARRVPRPRHMQELRGATVLWRNNICASCSDVRGDITARAIDMHTHVRPCARERYLRQSWLATWSLGCIS